MKIRMSDGKVREKYENRRVIWRNFKPMVHSLTTTHKT